MKAVTGHSRALRKSISVTRRKLPPNKNPCLRCSSMKVGCYGDGDKPCPRCSRADSQCVYKSQVKRKKCNPEISLKILKEAGKLAAEETDRRTTENEGDKPMLEVQFYSSSSDSPTLLPSSKSSATSPQYLHYPEPNFLSERIFWCCICLCPEFSGKTATSPCRCGHLSNEHFSDTEHGQAPSGFMPLLQTYDDAMLRTSSVDSQHYPLAPLADFGTCKPSLTGIKC
jgi:hypothetical protein